MPDVPERIVQIQVPSYERWIETRHMLVLTSYGRVLELNEYRDREGDKIHLRHEWDEVKLPPMPPRAPIPRSTLPDWEDETMEPPPTPGCQLCRDKGSICGYCYADQASRKRGP
jgi:hypothetical protein